MTRVRSVDLSGLAPLDPASLAGSDASLLASDDDWIVGLGRALTIWARTGIGELAQLTAGALAGLSEDRGGLGRPPLALGTLPFAPEHAATLVVPRVTIFGKGDRASDAIVVGPSRDAEVLEELSRRADSHPGQPTASIDAGWELVLLDAPERFLHAVTSALEAISAGSVDKVVLARRVRVSRRSPFDRVAALRILSDRTDGATVFAVGDFVGATPELVVERLGTAVASTPLAGSAPVGSEPARTALLRSAKDRLEHRVVVDAIAERLRSVVMGLDVPAEPHVLVAGPVAHLATPITGTLPHRSPLSALHLAASLHPTPAISGFPDSAARRLIGELEGWQRHRYGGLVGWVDAGGDGRFWLSIRGARLQGCSATLAAGAGIVAGSEPDAELEETTLKLEAVLGALRRS